MGSRSRTENILALSAAVVGALGFIIVWLVFPHEQEVESLWDYAAKLGAFFFLTVAIAFFPQRPPWLWTLLIIAFMVFAGYFFPRTGWFYFLDVDREFSGDFYTHLYLLTYPAIVMVVSAAYRLGGGTTGRTFKVAWSGVIVLFSGLLDIMFQVLKSGPWDTISAPHIVVFTGRPLTVLETMVFAAVHLPLLAVLIWLPLDRWLDRWLGQPAEQQFEKSRQ